MPDPGVDQHCQVWSSCVILQRPRLWEEIGWEATFGLPTVNLSWSLFSECSPYFSVYRSEEEHSVKSNSMHQTWLYPSSLSNRKGLPQRSMLMCQSSLKDQYPITLWLSVLFVSILFSWTCIWFWLHQRTTHWLSEDSIL
jgi:hypothetical protein